MIRYLLVHVANGVSRSGTKIRLFSTVITEDKIKQCYRILNIPQDSIQDAVRQAFVELAKRYHPDSGHAEANIERFCEIEEAFRILTKRNTGSTAEVDTITYDIKHTAPQHRQYLSFDGVGHGAPMQREKQYVQHRAQKAAQNVLEHRISKAIASDNTLMDKEKKAHDVKTQYGFDRLVEDLIKEAMSKGEFDNLSGKGKPLKGQSYNPYVDFTTHKLNEVLINNGFTPEWIMLNKDIKEEVAWLKEQLVKDRAALGPAPLSEADEIKWKETCREMEKHAKKINSRILSFNLVVPIIDKQMFLLKFEDIASDILYKGKFRDRAYSVHNLAKTKIDIKHNELKLFDVIIDVMIGIVAYLVVVAFKTVREKLARVKSIKFK